MARQRHDIGARKWKLSEPARRAAERRRAQQARIVRRRKRREARNVDPQAIAGWRAVQKKQA